jgi:putative endonuclease
MTMHNRILGQRGERLAEHHLTQMGAQLLARNYRIPFGEIDLVVQHEGELVAVEVKTRSIADLEQPEEAVSWGKLQRIVQALTTFAADTDQLESPWRIDVVAIVVESDGTVSRLDHMRSVYPA